MRTKTVEKQPEEDIVIGIDVTRWLRDSDTIQSIVDTVVYDSADTDVSSTMLAGAATWSGNIISAEVLAGEDENTYKLTVQFQTSIHPILEIDVPILVRET